MSSHTVKRAVIGHVAPTTVGDTITDETVVAMRRAVKAAKRAAKREERDANIAGYNRAMQRRQSRRGRRR